jgi:ubiquinone/menaquinone biosynthesis C-methylase UbiE
MKNNHLFPWWAGYLLLNPLRKMSLDPEKNLKEYVKPGMIVLDAGCAMGFFSLPLARLTGSNGKVICIDPQKRMLKTLKKRALRSGLSGIIDARLCSTDSLMIPDLRDRIDLALVFGVLHEVPDSHRFIEELKSGLKKNALFLFGEPHVISKPAFRRTVADMESRDFRVEKIIEKGKNKIAVLRRI